MGCSPSGAAVQENNVDAGSQQEAATILQGTDLEDGKAPLVAAADSEDKVDTERNGTTLHFVAPLECNCKQWLRIFVAKNLSSVGAIIGFIKLLVITPIYLPSMIFLLYSISTHTNVKHERADKVSIWLYNYFSMHKDERYPKFVVLKLLCTLGLLNKLKKNDPLQIVSHLGAGFGIEQFVRDFIDFHLFLPRMLVYYLHEYESMLRVEFPISGGPARLPDEKGGEVNLYRPSPAECKEAILLNLWGPMAHQCFEVEGRVGEWRVDFPEWVNPHIWVKMNCKAIGLKYLPAAAMAGNAGMRREQVLAALCKNPLNVDEWSIEIFLRSVRQREIFDEAEASNHTLKAGQEKPVRAEPFKPDGDESKAHTDEYALRCAIQAIGTSLPTIWHSWIHFPTQDLIAVWVAQQQAIHGPSGPSGPMRPFFKVFETHSISTKYNSQLVKELGRPTNTTSDPMSSFSSYCIVHPSNKDSFLYNTCLAFSKELGKTRPANMAFEPSLPYMKYMQQGMEAVEKFVEKSWDLIEPGAVEFVNFVHTASRGTMDFRTPVDRQKGLITRVIWSQTFHFADHAHMAMGGSKNQASFITLCPEMLAEDYLWGENWKWITQKMKASQPKLDNFLRMFADYSYQPNSTPTHNTFDYRVPELRELQEELRSGIKSAVEGICFDAGRIFKGYVDAERLGRNAPCSIDH